MEPAKLTHSFDYAGARHNVYNANKGHGLPRHEHTFNHVSICHSGSCVIRKENLEKVIDKNSGAFDLKANEWHEIEALEDNTVFVNIFAVTDNY
jgi:quercetin dioxygenase-like cupin family protein